jgi:outer membrane lipoprotein-sorting protein
MQKIGISFFLLAFSLFTGCTLFKRPTPPIDLTINSPEILLEKLRERNSRVQSLRSLAKIRVSIPEGKSRFSEVVIAQEPGRIRMEVLSFFGHLAALLVTDSSRLQALFLNEGQMYEGAASASNLSSFLPIPLPPEEIVSLLLGKASLIDCDPVDLELRQEKDLYILKLSSRTGERVQRLWIEPVNFRTVRSETTYPGDTTLLIAEFDDFKELNGEWFPASISIRIPSEAIDVKVKYQSPELNPFLASSLFTIAPPPGATLVELD